MTPHALITGAARRLGREIALHLARSGWNITIHCHRSQNEAKALVKEIEAMGRKAAIASADLQNDQAIATLIPQASRLIGPVTCFIHNASLFEKDSLADFSRARFEAHMRIHVYAGLTLLRHFAAALPEGTEGNAIMLTDGLRGWSVGPNFLSYSLSKLALEQAVPLLAPELAPRIRLNAIAPGHTISGVMDKEGTEEKVRALTPLKRVSNPEEVCRAIDFLLQSPSVTGQVISLNGGMHLI